MTFNDTFPYPSQRMPVMAKDVVATSQPLAAQAGLHMLAQGGNAVDAAVATAITLTVVEPTGNGIGSDAFAIVWDGTSLHGLNASGRSPLGLRAEAFAGLNAMPLRGWDSITVPGAVSAWVELSRRFGRLPFEQLFAAAIRYARDGFLVSPAIARSWARAPELFAQFPAFQRTFLPKGRAPQAGELFHCSDQADTLELLAATYGEAFYRGELADKMVAEAKAHGASLSEADLSEHRCQWVDTISMRYGGVDLHEIPPNGQGLAALLTLGILKRTCVQDYAVDSADSLHLQIEAMKLALKDAHRYVADPDYLDVDVLHLLDEAYLDSRAAMIDMGRAKDPGHGAPQAGGTVYLATADREGLMVSFIQSNYVGFGSGVVIPGTGIAMQNRGAGFTTTAGHPNSVGPGKRPFHTIIPGFVMNGGAPYLAYGVMGGPMQAQGHAQLLVRMRDYGQNAQAASDGPRWRVTAGLEVAVEAGFRAEVLEELTRRGHQIAVAAPDQSFSFGGAQLIERTSSGYIGASDHRKDGQAAGF